ncbi:GNAT family N-acetyltransferase [Roseateles sp. DAIF2]|nr:GNAT family N-acetyltransferase [Roseateles sp. DAIF2]
MNAADIPAVAEVHRASFVRQCLSHEWISASFNARPKTLAFVAEREGAVAAYIFWTQKSGFRPEVVLELEQLAVHPAHRARGVGRALIERSLPLVKALLHEQQGAVLKHVLVTTRADNHAQQLYRQTLGAEIEAVIPNLYSADEVLMVARHPPG